MMKITNLSELENEINMELKEMRQCTSIWQTSFAILRVDGIEIQVLLTRDTDNFHDDVLTGIAEKGSVKNEN